MDTGHPRRIAAFASAIGLFLPALWVELLVARGPEPRFQLVAFSLAIAISTLTAGAGPGLLVLGFSCVAIDYFLFGPGQMLRVASAAELTMLVVFAAGWTSLGPLVLASARRLRVEREGRAAADRTARNAGLHARLLGALGRARGADEVLEAALLESLYVLTADAGMICLIDQERAVAVVTRAMPARLEGEAVPLGIGSPLDAAIEQRIPIVVDSNDEWQAYPDLPEPVRLPRYAASAIVPLVAKQRARALLRLDFVEARRVTSDERDYLELLARHGGQILGRAWQYESSEQARADADALRARADAELAERQKTELALRASQTRYRALAARLARKQGLTAALLEARTVRAVAEEVVHHGLALAGATAGIVWLLEEGQARLRGLHASGPDEGATVPADTDLEPGVCATEAVQASAPVFVASWTAAQSLYWRSASLAADAGYRSSATLPLVGRAPIGVLEFHFSAPVHFDDEYRALLVSIAQHCTQALERAQAYEATDRARAEAEAANRMKDEFLSTVSHELRTPLNAVVGWSSLLKQQTTGAQFAALAIESIHENALRQARLIEDLLDAARLSSGQVSLDLEALDLETLLGSVANSVRPDASRGRLSLIIEPLPNAPIVGDRRRLEQVFFNVLGNALKFTPAGGRVIIGGAQVEGAVEIWVRDTGVGIEPELLAHVFDRFRQGDASATRSRGGLGLGLSIARQLVEAHGGSIAMESGGRNTGTTVRVTLPLASDTAADTSPAPGSVVEAAAPTAPHLDGVTVLLVEDERSTREVMVHGLQMYGAMVWCASSATEALAVLERGPVDVLLSDLAMPDEDGYSLIERVRRSSDPCIASIPAAAVTAYARDTDRARALAAGFQLHLAKPIEPTALARAVERLKATRPSAA